MAAFNASAFDGSRTQLVTNDNSNSTSRAGQCGPVSPPALGTLMLVKGDGRSIGTVMTLQCPPKHRPVSGEKLSCVLGSNSTLWSGGVPECRPLAEFGFRVALIISLVSSIIILIMSIVFITSCLLKCVRKEDRRRQERERTEYWQQMERDEFERRTESYFRQKGQNNNNNNNMRKDVSEEWSAPLTCRQSALRDHTLAYWCQSDYSYPLLTESICPPLMPVLPSSPLINPLSAPAPSPATGLYSCSLPTGPYPRLPSYREYSSELGQSPWQHSLPGVDGRRELEDPYRRNPHQVHLQAPPFQVIAV